MDSKDAKIKRPQLVGDRRRWRAEYGRTGNETYLMLILWWSGHPDREWAREEVAAVHHETIYHRLPNQRDDRQWAEDDWDLRIMHAAVLLGQTRQGAGKEAFTESLLEARHGAARMVADQRHPHPRKAADEAAWRRRVDRLSEKYKKQVETGMIKLVIPPVMGVEGLTVFNGPEGQVLPVPGQPTRPVPGDGVETVTRRCSKCKRSFEAESRLLRRCPRCRSRPSTPYDQR